MDLLYSGFACDLPSCWPSLENYLLARWNDTITTSCGSPVLPRRIGAMEIISLQQGGFSSDVRVSGDGRFVAFSSQAANLLPAGAEKRQCFDPIIVGAYPCYDLIVYDRQTKELNWIN